MNLLVKLKIVENLEQSTMSRLFCSILDHLFTVTCPKESKSKEINMWNGCFGRCISIKLPSKLPVDEDFVIHGNLTI